MDLTMDDNTLRFLIFTVSLLVGCGTILAIFIVVINKDKKNL